MYKFSFIYSFNGIFFDLTLPDKYFTWVVEPRCKTFALMRRKRAHSWPAIHIDFVPCLLTHIAPFALFSTNLGFIVFNLFPCSSNNYLATYISIEE
jgi:hypothetical protein